MNFFSFLITGLGLLLAVATVSARAIDMHAYALKPLDVKEDSFESLRGRVDVLMFFEPECSWCFKQTRLLNQLQRECSGFRAAAIGINGSKRDLKRELLKQRPDFPAFQINKALQADIGKIQGTPLMLFLDGDGQFVSYSRGYQRKPAMTALLDQFSPDYCRAENKS